jgi:elongation factor G
VGNPQVVCRETIRQTARGTGEFDRELGEQAHYGLVELSVAPASRSAGVSVAFVEDIVNSTDWNPGLMASVEQGVRDACWSGPSGYVVEDIAVSILHMGRKQGGLATTPGLHMAAQQALRQALEKAVPLVLEPLMRVDVAVPENFLGAVISLLGARGAHVEGLDDRVGQKHIQALAPMRELFGFATALRSVSQGRAGLVMRFLRFDSVSSGA